MSSRPVVGCADTTKTGAFDASSHRRPLTNHDNADVVPTTNGRTCRPRRRARRVALWCVSGTLTVVLLTPLVMYGLFLSQETATPRVVALMYHRFVTDDQYEQLTGDERVYSISASRFEAHLRRLRDEGYVPVTLPQVRAWLLHGAAIAPRSVLITIDDGCRSVATHAAPLLRRYGMRAALFVTTDPGATVFRCTTSPAGTEHDRARLADAELRTLCEYGIDLGAHGHTHVPMHTLNDDELHHELQAPRDALAAISGAAIDALAIPGNWHNNRVRQTAADLGYTLVFVSDPGSIGRDSNRARLPRMNVSGTYSADQLMQRLSPAATARRRVWWAMMHPW